MVAGFGRYTVAVSRGFGDALEPWRRMVDEGGAATPFAQADYLRAWERTIGAADGRECYAATIHDRGRPVLGLPLVRERRGGGTFLFADGGVTDYNAPLLGAGAPRTRAEAVGAWLALCRALPPSAAIRFEKMPERVGAAINPLALLPQGRPSTSIGLSLDMPRGFGAWHGGLPRRYRMELNRCSRLFDALPKARYASLDQGDGAEAVLDALERMQRARIGALSLPYELDRTDIRAFYRALAAATGGSCVLTALISGAEVVAVLLGIRRADHYVMLRIAAAPEHSRVSPARTLIIRTMEDLAATGVTAFDFGLGDYPYKRRLGGETVALRDLVVARSLAGVPALMRFRLEAAARRDPRLAGAARRLRALVRRGEPTLPPPAEPGAGEA